MKITSENINSDDCSIVQSIDLKDQIRRISSAWLALRDSGKIKDCDCKRPLPDLEIQCIEKTKAGYRCKYILTKCCLGQRLHQFAIWTADSFSQLRLYDRFGQCCEIINGRLVRNNAHGCYDLIDQTGSSSGCDQCEIDFLVQEAFEIEGSGE